MGRFPLHPGSHNLKRKVSDMKNWLNKAFFALLTMNIWLRYPLYVLCTLALYLFTRHVNWLGGEVTWIYYFSVFGWTTCIAMEKAREAGLRWLQLCYMILFDSIAIVATIVSQAILKANGFHFGIRDALLIYILSSLVVYSVGHIILYCRKKKETQTVTLTFHKDPRRAVGIKTDDGETY
jgi:hypothetical protein